MVVRIEDFSSRDIYIGKTDSTISYAMEGEVSPGRGLFFGGGGGAL